LTVTVLKHITHPQIYRVHRTSTVNCINVPPLTPSLRLLTMLPKLVSSNSGRPNFCKQIAPAGYLRNVCKLLQQMFFRPDSLPPSCRVA